MGFFHELGKGLKGLHRGGKSALRDSFSTAETDSRVTSAHLNNT